jgi:hypothetical protein
MGHSEKIASEHYWRATDADFERALQNPVQTRTAGELKSSEAQRNEANENNEECRQSDDSCDASPDCVPILFTASETVSPAGLELARQFSSLDDSTASAAEINALGPNSGPIDPGLVEVIEAWPSLLSAARADVLATVRAASGAG